MCPRSDSKSKGSRSSSRSADARRTKDQLIDELTALRRKAARLEKKLHLHGGKNAHSSDPTYYNALLKYPSDPILVCDEKGLPVLFNEAYKNVMKNVLGIDMKPGLQPHKLLPDEDEVAWWDNIHRRVLGGESFKIDYAIPVSGVERSFELSYTPVKDGGQVRGFVEITRDVTERKAVEKELRKYKEQLEELVAKRTNDLEDSRNQLRELIMHMNEQLEEERKRISREVHDELGQLLAAQNMDLAMLSKSDALNNADIALKIESMQELNRHMMTTVKDIVNQLRPPALEILGLSDAIRHDVAAIQKKYSITCNVQIRVDEDRMSMTLKSTLYRMVQESLTNVVRHSHASEVNLVLEQENEAIRFSLSDNGRGLPATQLQADESFGIIGMKERVRGLGGEFSLFNNEQGGVTVVARIPI